MASWKVAGKLIWSILAIAFSSGVHIGTVEWWYSYNVYIYNYQNRVIHFYTWFPSRWSQRVQDPNHCMASGVCMLLMIPSNTATHASSHIRAQSGDQMGIPVELNRGNSEEKCY